MLFALALYHAIEGRAISHYQSYCLSVVLVFFASGRVDGDYHSARTPWQWFDCSAIFCQQNGVC
eukprot:1317021-Amphidinium_carterae.1